MTIENVAYWGAFAIPLILIIVGAWIDMLIDAVPFKREHFYMGIDLTVYFLAAALVNFLDIAKETSGRTNQILWTLLLVIVAFVTLLIQMGIFQRWRGPQNYCRTQLIMLCYVSNGIGVGLLYGFFKMKAGGLI